MINVGTEVTLKTAMDAAMRVELSRRSVRKMSEVAGRSSSVSAGSTSASSEVNFVKKKHFPGTNHVGAALADTILRSVDIKMKLASVALVAIMWRLCVLIGPRKNPQVIRNNPLILNIRNQINPLRNIFLKWVHHSMWERVLSLVSWRDPMRWMRCMISVIRKMNVMTVTLCTWSVITVKLPSWLMWQWMVNCWEWRWTLVQHTLWLVRIVSQNHCVSKLWDHPVLSCRPTVQNSWKLLVIWFAQCSMVSRLSVIWAFWLFPVKGLPCLAEIGCHTFSLTGFQLVQPWMFRVSQVRLSGGRAYMCPCLRLHLVSCLGSRLGSEWNLPLCLSFVKLLLCLMQSGMS